MSTIFTRVLSGQVDVIPGDVRMLSTASSAEVLAPGFLNRAAVAASFTIFETDVISALYGDPQVAAIFKPSLSGGIYTLVPIAGASGEANTSSNVGAGEGLALPKSGIDLPFKSIEAGANIALTPTGNSVIIEAVIPDVGEANTASNVGLGAGVFKQKVGVDLEFKSIVAGAGIGVSIGTSEITIASTSSADITGAANVGGGVEVFRDEVGGILNFRTLVNGTNTTVVQNANTFQINASGGGGGSFDYVKAYWVARNGSDSNSGLSIDQPKLTIQGALTAIGADTSATVINIQDSGSYAGPFTFPSNGSIFLNAPSAFLTCAVNNMFTMTGGTLNIVCKNISASALRLFNCSGVTIFLTSSASVFGLTTNDVGSSTRMFINVGNQIGGDITVSSNGTNIIHFDSFTGDFIDTSVSGSTKRNGLFGRSMTGNISSTNTTIYGEIQIVNGTVSDINHGYFNGINYGFTDTVGTGINLHDQAFSNQTFYGVTTLTGNYTLLGTDTGKTFIVDSAGTVQVTFPETASDPNFPEFFYCRFLQFQGGKVRIIPETNVILESVGGDDFSGGRGSWSQVALMKQDVDINQTRTISFGGQISSSSLVSSLGIYVSAATGSDITGDGSALSPLATIGAAITLAGVPSSSTPIYLMGAQNYDEEVTIANANIYIVGPQSTIYSTTGDALTISSNSSAHPIFLGGLGSSVGSSFVGTGDSAIVFNIGAFTQGAILTTNNQVFINADLIDVDITVSAGTGFVNYTTAERQGTNTGAVYGINPTGTSTSFIAEGFIVSNTGFIAAAQSYLQAGSPGFEGKLFLYPSAASTGTMQVTATANLANVGTILTNQPVSLLSTFKLPATSKFTSTLLNSKVDDIDPASDLIYFEQTITAANLAGGASNTIIAASTGGQYRIRELFVNSGGTNFSGGGGDRNISIRDSVTTYSVIPSATAQALVNARWGSTDIPFPASAALNTLTQVSNNLTLVYSGGTTDYSAGSITISGCWERIV